MTRRPATAPPQRPPQADAFRDLRASGSRERIRSCGPGDPPARDGAAPAAAEGGRLQGFSRLGFAFSESQAAG